jgi:photosystem II stability/assembly factor-like uncharacterized protein
MKTKLLNFLLFVGCICAPSLHAQWTKLPIYAYNPILKVNAFLVKGDDIFAGCDSDRIFRSTDNGSTWVETDSGLNRASRIAALASEGDTIIAGTSRGIFISTDNGNHWLKTQLIEPILSLAFNGRTLYAGGNMGLFRSSDNGVSWDTVFSTAKNSIDISAIAFKGDTVLAGNFISIDSGKSWVDISSFSHIYAFASLDSKIIAATSSDIYTSTDNGINWQSSNVSVSGTGFLALAVSGNIVAAAAYQDIYLSLDRGSRWKNITDASLKADYFDALTIKDGKIFAGAIYSGGWVRNLSDILQIATAPTIDNELSISPNPTTGMLTIRNAPENLTVVSILNVLGQKVLEVAAPQTPEFYVDLSALPAGMYYARFSSEGEVVTKKIIKE